MSGNLFEGWKWKWSMVLLNVGMLGMIMGMLVAGFAQSQIERAPLVVLPGPLSLRHRNIHGCAGYALAAGFRYDVCSRLCTAVWDLLTIGEA